MDYSVIILCAGVGKRTGLNYNKMFYIINGKTIYNITLELFIKDNRCKQIIVVCKENEKEDFKRLCNNNKIEYVLGGKERQDSVYNGLQVVKYDYVLIHDGARPYVKLGNINNLLKALQKHKACLLMVPCKDTIKEIKNGKIIKTLERKSLMQAQTPQAFNTTLIKEAYGKGIKNNYKATDDAQMVEVFTNEDVYVVLGDYTNTKVTTKEDLK